MIKRKLQSAFFTLAIITFLSVIGAVLYLQSESFAQIVKNLISERSPRRLGVIGDFKNLKLYFFPPGIGVADLAVEVHRDNVAKIPAQGKIVAREARITFAPIQMLSGTLLVDELKIVGGELDGMLDLAALSAPKKKVKSKTSWKDLIELQINGVRFEDTRLKVNFISAQAEPGNVDLTVTELTFRKQDYADRSGIYSRALAREVRLNLPKSIINLPIKQAYQLQWEIQGNDREIKLSPFLIDIPGLMFKMNGRIVGNVFDEQSALRLETESQVQTNLKTFMIEQFNRKDLAGRLSGNVRTEGDLRKLNQTLKMHCQLSGQDVIWNQMQVDNFEGQGSVDLAANEAHIKSLHLVREYARGEPGEVFITETVLPLAFNRPFTSQLNLKNADMHWLGGAAIKAVYPLQGRIGGHIAAAFTPASSVPWKIQITPKIRVDDFSLSNQKYQVKRPLNMILKPTSPIEITGDVFVQPGVVSFQDMAVSMKNSRLAMSGRVSGSEGYALAAEGNIDLQDMDQISEIPIRGKGQLTLNVHGPTDHVQLDFGMDVSEAEYLNLSFGRLKGDLTYDDGTFELRFKNMLGQYGKTNYSLNNGWINLDAPPSAKDELFLPIQLNAGRIEDVARIMGPFTKKLSWYPERLIGALSGLIEVSGKLKFSKMNIVAAINGNDWELYGEKARRIQAEFGYEQGTYFARKVNLLKTNGIMRGDVQFDSTSDQLGWNFTSENFSLKDIDFIDRLQVPARARLDFKSSGRGKLGQVVSSTELKLVETLIKGEALESSAFSLEMSEKVFRLKADVFGERLKAQIRYAMTPKQPSKVSIALNQFDFSPMMLVLNPKLLDDPLLKGRIDGSIDLDFLSEQAELARGNIALRSYEIRKTGASMTLLDPVDVPIQLGFFELKPIRFHFKDSDLIASGEGSRGNIDLKVEGKTDLAVAEFFSSSIEKIQGKADTVLRLTGPIKQMKVNGDITFEDARFQMRWLQTPFEEMGGAIRLRQSMIYVEAFEGYLGDELFNFGGKIETFANHFPTLDLRANFEDNKVKMLPLDMVQVRGVPWIKGTEPPYEIGGSIEVLQALWKKSFTQSSGGQVRGERFAPSAQQNANSSSLFVLNLECVAPGSFFVRNEILDAEFRGKGRLVGPPDNPRILGEAHLVQGKILFRDRPFNLDSVRVDFDDPLQTNPKFNASAVSEIGQYKIRLLAAGRASQWKAEFNSTPFLPESEIYSLMTSGMTSSEVGRFRSRDRSYVNQGEAASLILHQMEFSQDVQRKTGLQFDVEEGYDQQQATSAFRPQSTQDNVASPKVVIKRKVGRKFTLGVGTTVGVGNETVREANAEYQVSPAFSVLGIWNAYEGVNTQQTRTSYGLDLRINKKFK